jgi:hypothetical protein
MNIGEKSPAGKDEKDRYTVSRDRLCHVATARYSTVHVCGKKGGSSVKSAYFKVLPILGSSAELGGVGADVNRKCVSPSCSNTTRL